MKVKKIGFFRTKVYITFENDEELTLSKEIFNKYNLFVGVDYSESEIENLINLDEIFLIKKSAANLVQRREHSRKEVRDKLKIKKFKIENIDKVLDEFVNMNLINDKRFTKSFVESRFFFRKKSPKAISFELRKKGITSEYIEDSLNKLEREKIFEVALSLADKKNKIISKHPLEIRLQKIRNHLLYKGFDIEVINFVLTELKRKEV